MSNINMRTLQTHESQLLELVGLKTYISTPKLVPKLTLSEKLDVSEGFRKQTNDWLRERFGYKEPAVKDDAIYMSEQFGTAVMSPRTAAALIDSSVV